MESAGKKVEYKGQLIKSLISMGALYGAGVRKTIGGRSMKLYPFDPESLDISAGDVTVTGKASEQVSV